MTIFRFGRALLWMAIGAALAATGFFLYLRSITRPEAVAPRIDPPSVVQQIRQASELVSVKYTVQKVVGLEEKKVPFGAERILLFVQAEVLGGVDLASLEPRHVTVERDRSVTIYLPPPRILQVVIDDHQTKVWDRRITWWTPWVPQNPDLERQARLKAREAIEQAAIEMGLVEQARRNAETVIRVLLAPLGAASVTILPAS